MQGGKLEKAPGASDLLHKVQVGGLRPLQHLAHPHPAGQLHLFHLLVDQLLYLAGLAGELRSEDWSSTDPTPKIRWPKDSFREMSWIR